MQVNHFIPGDEFRAVGLEVFLTSERIILTSRGMVRRNACNPYTTRLLCYLLIWMIIFFTSSELYALVAVQMQHMQTMYPGVLY